MSPRPTKSIGKRSRVPKMLVSTSTYFGEATLPSRTMSQSAPISEASARALCSSGLR
jgi:hypothetical protein